MIKLKFFGLGGQGVVTAGQIFSKAVSLYEGKFAVTIPSYGHERRGAPVNTSVIIDDKEVLVNSFVYNPDIVIVMDQSIINKNVDISAGISKDSIMVLNASSSQMVDRFEKMGFKYIYYVDATRIAKQFTGFTIPNGAMLGVLAATDVVSIESIERAITDSFKGKAADLNAKAARESYKQTNKR